MVAIVKNPGKRTIRTNYYFRNELVRTTLAVHPERAVANCLMHMQFDDYGALLAEVYDESNGKLYSVIKRHIAQKKIDVFYRRGFFTRG